MKDPYSILGVSPNDSDETIKQAYKELAKKYHPDIYQGNQLKDLAEEKMAEINGAYDDVTNQRKNRGVGAGYPNGGYGYGGGYSNQSTGEYLEIRRLIESNQILAAQTKLENMPESMRNAEWNYLMGHIYHTRGFLEDAVNYVRKAVEMDPSNMEYKSAYQMLMNNAAYGGSPNVHVSACPSCGPCGLCSSLICADCTCSACRCCC